MSLVLTGGFNGIDSVIQQAYPMAKQQRCLIHISRNIDSKVKQSDREPILAQFKQIYHDSSYQEASDILAEFITEWKPRYKKVMASLESTENLQTFYQFANHIWSSFTLQIWLNHLIRKLNGEIRRRLFSPMMKH